MSITPSGQQFEIRNGAMTATVVEVGGGLRSVTAGDLDVLDGFPEDEMCHDGRGQILIPWPNRLAGGKYEFNGKTMQLPLSEASQGNAIHGLVRWANWTGERQGENRVTMAHRLYPMPGYPFALDLSAGYTLDDTGLSVTLQATNAGNEPCPFGAGQHPYARVGTGLIDEAELHVPARTIHTYDEHLIPTARVPVDGTPLDFRQPRRLGDTVINMDYTDLERGADGMARITLAAPSGTRVDVWMDQAFPHATVYTGETVQPPERRRHGLAIEPMSCPPNAFVSGDDLVVLQPGQSWQGRWGISVTPR